MERFSSMLVVACVATLPGCAVRYDHAGVTRVGVGLWGLGDPPGVKWNLDWPRNEVPELPPMRKPDVPELPPMRKPEVPELPPMRPRELSDATRSLAAPIDDLSSATTPRGAAERGGVIDDNRPVGRLRGGA